MFERFTEKARRAVFFARYEASQFGSPQIETEHLLLGILREDRDLMKRFVSSNVSLDSIRTEIEDRTVIRKVIPTNVDLPLSDVFRQVLTHAAEEAERLRHKHIGTEHLLLGLLQDEKSSATLLLKRGVNAPVIRASLVENLPENREVSGSSKIVDFAQSAGSGDHLPVLGRELEVEATLQVLSGRFRTHPILVGERGVGKTAIVETIARRISAGQFPSLLDRRIVMLSSPALANLCRSAPAERPFRTLHELAANATTIFVLDDIHLTNAEDVSSVIAAIAGRSGDSASCMATTTPAGYRHLTEILPWITDVFRPIYIGTVDHDRALSIVDVRKSILEDVHQVTFPAETVRLSVQSAESYLPSFSLPGKALQLLDAAAIQARVSEPKASKEVAEAEAQLQATQHRITRALENHELERARGLSAEEREQRDRLRQSRLSESAPDKVRLAVTPHLLEEIIERWSKYPFASP